ncbi:uncharacterized protein APUU_51501S [Aspergillus puulaauensis]|uniref:Uncharacterized protein n=1 Tax=Aspergillus puulaauensis TaxID=1220207 RepID=A0A7R7XS76_9EURO|nr:uncharacterized protein APUU_51501S [Aspergillus puulaauensis]BCS26790.1 hypothetical protein APUU_51501S [Aspergillus puulaauensis]
MHSYKIYLGNEDYNEDDCRLAVRGQLIPKALGEDTTQLCVVRGIRYHAGYATELRGLLPIFTRALNARDIMSNKVPDMSGPDEFPYCIWHPETASEATYRALALRYPQMKYQIGRACAVAGYAGLFSELGLLPECHIAEEARESQQWEIYNVIMKADIRYNAMDDYTRTVFNQPSKGYLNGDTAVQSYLDIKTEFEAPPDWDDFPLVGNRRQGFFDITEDDRIDEFTSEPPPTEDDVSHFLYTPLPVDLPTMNKDVLILMAAYYGDVDRYSRLRRPRPVMSEPDCVVRGIYHNTMFAKWWSLQKPSFMSSSVQKAINARFIMNNDLSRITPETKHLAYCIWYPSVPHPSTCKELFRRLPSMKPAIARACILADYPETWDFLDVDPDENLMMDARQSHNPKYLRDLESKLPERGCPQYPQAYTRSESRVIPRHHMCEYTSIGMIEPNVANNPCADTESGVPYNGMRASMAYTELTVALPDELRQLAKELWDRDYAAIQFDDKYYASLASKGER